MFVSGPPDPLLWPWMVLVLCCLHYRAPEVLELKKELSYSTLPLAPHCYDLGITICYFLNKEKKRIDRLKVKVIFACLFFFFNQSKNNAVLEPKIGNFSGLVGFETKAKDLSIEAKAKDFKKCP